MLRKLNIKSLSLILLLILISSNFIGCLDNSPIARIKRNHNFNLELPKGYEVLCNLQGETYVGKAPALSIIKLTEEPTDLLQSFLKENSKLEENNSGNKYVIDEFSPTKNAQLKETIDLHQNCCLKIPSEFYPNWEDDYMWIEPSYTKDATAISGIIFIYFPNTLNLIIYEAGY